MKIVTVIGARPQFIKAAPVSRALAAAGLVEVVVHTGQHYDDNMSGVFFEELEMAPPAFNLGVGSGSHGVQTARMLEGIERVLLEVQPDWLVVYGDTNSTLAAAVAASKLHVPVAHVEAGLRSFNRRMPEEVNRVLTDHASTLLFAPTAAAVAHLAAEGIAGASVVEVGDVMYDAALHFGDKAARQSLVLDRLGLAPASYILATAHRAENTDDPERLRAVVLALSAIAAELPVVLPLHPRTRAALHRTGLLEQACATLKVIEPVGYLDMVTLERHARLIATDSGGVQKEAFFYRVPCVTLRDETEWMELVELGWNRLVSPVSPGVVTAAITESLQTAERAEPPAGLFGGGQAAPRIARSIVEHGRG